MCAARNENGVEEQGGPRRRILYVQFANPAAYPPLEHSSRLFADSGWDVAFLGRAAQLKEPLKMPYHPCIGVHCWSFRPSGVRQKMQYLAYAFWVAWWCFWWRPDVVYVSNAMACPSGWVAARVMRCRVVYHEHDSPSEDEKDAPRSVFNRLILRTRRSIARVATMNVLPNGPRAAMFARVTGAQQRVQVVWNCPSIEDAREPAKLRDGFRIFYHGSIVRDRPPLSVIRALATLPDDCRVIFAGYETVGSRGYCDEIRRLAEHLGVGARVEFLGVLQRASALLAACRRASVGLCLMPMVARNVNESAMTGASNKPFEYLACGLPLLISDLPDWRELYAVPGYARACDARDTANVAEALRWFYDHPAERRAMGECGRQRILAEWNYEKQFAPVMEHLRPDHSAWNVLLARATRTGSRKLPDVD